MYTARRVSAHLKDLAKVFQDFLSELSWRDADMLPVERGSKGPTVGRSKSYLKPSIIGGMSSLNT